MAADLVVYLSAKPAEEGSAPNATLGAGANATNGTAGADGAGGGPLERKSTLSPALRLCFSSHSLRCCSSAS